MNTIIGYARVNSLGSRRVGRNPRHHTGPGSTQVPGRSGRQVFAEGSCKGLREHPDWEEWRQTQFRSLISKPRALPDHQPPYAGPPSSLRQLRAIFAEKREDVNVLRVGMVYPCTTLQRGAGLMVGASYFLQDLRRSVRLQGDAEQGREPVAARQPDARWSDPGSPSECVARDGPLLVSRNHLAVAAPDGRLE